MRRLRTLAGILVLALITIIFVRVGGGEESGRDTVSPTPQASVEPVVLTADPETRRMPPLAPVTDPEGNYTAREDAAATTAINGVTEEPTYYDEVTDPDFHGYPEPTYTEIELIMTTQTVWGEARGCPPEEQRLVIWTIFQQVDAGGEFSRYDSITKVITKPNNFVGYDEENPIDPDIYALVCEEAAKWWHGVEPPTLAPYAPTLPYLFFDGDGTHNWFRAEWQP